VLALASGCTLLTPVEPPALEASVELDAVPFFPQDSYQCGPAALATVLATTGLPVSAQALVDDVYLPDRRGSLQAELAAAARRHGRVPFPVAAGEEALVAELLAGHPVLVLQNLGLDSLPRWHYAVVVGYHADEEHWVLRSGRERRRRESLRAFRRHWQGADRWGLVVLPPGQLPALAEARDVLEALAAAEPVLGAEAILPGWTQASARWPGDADLAFAAANGLRAAGRAQAALRHYRRAIANDPQHAAARNNLADLLLAYDCVGQARAALAPALAAVDDDDPLRPVLAATAAEIAQAGPAACRLENTQEEMQP
jgi:tetratricopeptide (TPR) repeat protein